MRTSLCCKVDTASASIREACQSNQDFAVWSTLNRCTTHTRQLAQLSACKYGGESTAPKANLAPIDIGIDTRNGYQKVIDDNACLTPVQQELNAC